MVRSFQKRMNRSDGSTNFDETLHAPSPNGWLTKSADGSKAKKNCITGLDRLTHSAGYITLYQWFDRQVGLDN